MYADDIVVAPPLPVMLLLEKCRSITRVVSLIPMYRHILLVATVISVGL